MCGEALRNGRCEFQLVNVSEQVFNPSEVTFVSSLRGLTSFFAGGYEVFTALFVEKIYPCPAV